MACRQGSCVVLKKLQGVVARATGGKPRSGDADFLTPKLRALILGRLSLYTVNH